MTGSHDFYCPDCRTWWSPLDHRNCPDHRGVDRSFYDAEHEAGCPSSWWRIPLGVALGIAIVVAIVVLIAAAEPLLGMGSGL